MALTPIPLVSRVQGKGEQLVLARGGPRAGFGMGRKEAARDGSRQRRSSVLWSLPAYVGAAMDPSQRPSAPPPPS